MLLAFALAGHLFAGQDQVLAADYFPLVPGTKWVYTDSSTPGTTISEIVEKAIVPDYLPIAEGRPEGTVLEPFFPVRVTQNGQVAGRPCFRTIGDTLYLVGPSPTRPSTPRPILKVGADQVWEFDSDPVSPFDPTPVHVKCRAKPGPVTKYFGKACKTVVLTNDAKVGGKKGLAMHQECIYAEGIGMVEFNEEGTAGGRPIKHTRKLISFEKKEGSL